MQTSFSICDLNTGAAYLTLKRGLDITGAFVLLAVSCPLAAVIAALVKAESPGPVFFLHERIGQGGKKIKILKFRSMREGSENLEAVLNDEDLELFYREYRLANDPRITEIGRSLRRTSLDELPQLLNILLGSMSFVGPRPVTEGELAFYTEEEREVLLSVRPGLTGLWQISDRNRYNYQNGGRRKKELFYAENASLSLDARILLKTPAAVIRKARDRKDGRLP